jgi:tripeptide aminopeptidase
MPTPDDAVLGRLSLFHLQAVVAIDSASDEDSTAVPTTVGQTVLAQHLAEFYGALGAQVEQDDHANVIASLPGRGTGVDKPPVALLVHLDTARGTEALQSLHVLPKWDGSPVPYPENPGLRVDVDTYPDLREFVDHDVVYGSGTAPFGLDDKLGLAHCMTLAKVLLHLNPTVSHPPLLLIARPDEEVGRDEALIAVAQLLAQRGVPFGYTVDGIWPYEINVENFNAAGGTVRFEGVDSPPMQDPHTLVLKGVNTHGATAKAEGHRSALRFAAELQQRGVRVAAFCSDELRDCDGVCVIEGAPRDQLDAVVGPHTSRGASWSLTPGGQVPERDATAHVLAWVSAFHASDPGFALAAEDSAGGEGYSALYRARPSAEGMRVSVRIRDFSPEGLQARIAHVVAQAGERAVDVVHQYDNMGPALAECPQLVDVAQAAADRAGLPTVVQPIRGGTGVDPFLQVGVPIGNLGTGYFAPESEKELTSLQHMAGHARWLVELVQGLAN